MLLMAAKSREVVFAMALMTADSVEKEGHGRLL